MAERVTRAEFVKRLQAEHLPAPEPRGRSIDYLVDLRLDDKPCQRCERPTKGRFRWSDGGPDREPLCMTCLRAVDLDGPEHEAEETKP